MSELEDFKELATAERVRANAAEAKVDRMRKSLMHGDAVLAALVYQHGERTSLGWELEITDAIRATIPRGVIGFIRNDEKCSLTVLLMESL